MFQHWAITRRAFTRFSPVLVEQTRAQSIFNMRLKPGRPLAGTRPVSLSTHFNGTLVPRSPGRSHGREEKKRRNLMGERPNVCVCACVILWTRGLLKRDQEEDRWWRPGEASTFNPSQQGRVQCRSIPSDNWVNDPVKDAFRMSKTLGLIHRMRSFHVFQTLSTPFITNRTDFQPH